MTGKSNQSVIYESPDGGKTVYARTFGSTDRQPINPPYYSRTDRRLKNVAAIIMMAEYDSELNELFEKLEIVYELKRKS
jgi:hypothetical protein